MPAQKKPYDVLLVEDDPFLYKVLMERLKHEGLSVKVAKDGAAALTQAEAQPPRLLLLDLILPKKSGFEVLASLRRKARLKNLPVVVLSNLGQQEDIDQMQRHGVREYIVKADYSLSEIVEKIKSHLQAVMR